LITYLDASVILRRVLGQPEQIEWRALDATASSSLTRVECLRTVDRLRMQRAVSDSNQMDLREALFAIFDTCSMLEVGSPVIERAAMPYPVVLKTLDAVHLASALILQESSGESVRFATHDRALARASRAMGFEVVGAA
jgi:predicted nucleic acid-binding protein